MGQGHGPGQGRTRAQWARAMHGPSRGPWTRAGPGPNGPGPMGPGPTRRPKADFTRALPRGRCLRTPLTLGGAPPPPNPPLTLGGFAPQTPLTLGGGLCPPQTPPWGACGPPDPPAFFEGASPPRAPPFFFKTQKWSSGAGVGRFLRIFTFLGGRTLLTGGVY